MSESNDRDVSSQAEQGMFDEKISQIMDNFGEQCQEANIKTSCAFVIQGDTRKPVIFLNGNKFEIAKMLALILKNIKADILNDLEC